MTIPPTPAGTPTAADIKRRFPELAEADDTALEFAIQEALLFIDPLVWSAADFPLAVMYFVAHLATSRNLAAPSDSLDDSAMTYVSSIAVGADGSRRTMFRESSGTVGGLAVISGDLKTTSYGNVLLALRRRNFPAIALV